MQQTTAAEVRLDADKAARFSASAQSTGLVRLLLRHAVRDLPLLTTGEGAIFGPTTTPNRGNVGYKNPHSPDELAILSALTSILGIKFSILS